MNKFLNKLTIQQKMRFGFGVIWVVLAIITIQAAINLSLVRVNVADVVENKQPLVLASNDLINSLEKTMNAISVYMLTGDQHSLNEYEQNFQQATVDLKHLKHKVSLLSQTQRTTSQRLLQNVEQKMNSLPMQVEAIRLMQASPLEKYPAFKFVDENMAAMASQIQNQISTMLASEMAIVSPDRVEMLQSLMRLQNNWLNVLSGVRGYVAFRSQMMADNTEMYLDTSEKILNELAQQTRLEFTFEEELALPEVVAAFEDYRKHFATLKIIHQGEKWRMDIWMMEREVKPVFEVLVKDLDKLVDISVTDMVAVSEDVVDSSLNNIILLLALSIIGQIVGMLISRRVTQSVVDPVNNAMLAMKDMAKGEGDLTRRLPIRGTDELALLSNYFNIFIERIQKVLNQLALTVAELEKSSVDLLNVTKSTKQGSDKQLKAASELTDSIQQMTQQAKRVEEHSRNASNATEQAARRVKQGSHVVSGANVAIQSLSQGMHEMASAVNQLDKDSDSIGQVVSVIRDIAEQTNLLALNAAIEAARAGEHGRGFAVVADEVRGLAQRTQESTLEIENIIEEIRQATQRTVKVVNSGHETSDTSCQAIETAQRELAPVVVLMEDISQMSEQMFCAAESQASLAHAVNEHISQIHQISELTAKDALNTEKSGHQMQALADRLDTIVHQFKI